MKKLPLSSRALISALACTLLLLPVASIAQQGVTEGDHGRDGDAATEMNDPAEDSRSADSASGDYQERYRMGTQEQAGLTEESKDDIREVLVSVLEGAISGEVGEVTEYLAKNDRDRLEAEQDVEDTALQNESEKFREKWESAHGESFEDSIDAQAMNVEFVSGEPERSASVRISQGGQPFTIQLVNEGTLLDAWRIDAPDSLTQQKLQNDIRTALSEVSGKPDKQQLTHKILKSFSKENV